jgi:hypothetical protein
VADPQPTARSASTIVISVHGQAGVLDLAVPAGATSVDVAREYAAQSGLAGIPLLQTPLGELVRADRALADVGVESGDVLVAASGVHRPRAACAGAGAGARRTTDNPALAALVATVAAVAAGLSAWYAARAADDLLRTLTVGLLMTAALVSTLPVGRHASSRVAVAPAFGAAAAFAALYEPGAHLLPTVAAVSALAAAVVAAVARALGAEHDEALVVWMVAGVLAFGACGLSPLLEWDPRVSWTLLLVTAVLAARFAPSLAVDVPDEALLDLERLAVTAWSARDRTTGRRGRLVVPRSAMSRLVASATRTVTASAVAILVVTVVATPLLLAAADIDLDRIGARCLAFFGGAAVLLAARSYRHAARTLLRAAGLAAWVALAAFLVGDVAPGLVATGAVAAVLLGAATLAAAVATGRGWRSVWWSRRAEVAEVLSGSFALAAAVVAAGLFRVLWETTS